MVSTPKMFPITIGDFSFSHMKKSDLTREYLGWLNDKSHMKWSNQRAQNHTKSTSKKFLRKHDKTQNLYLSIKYRNEMIGTITIYVDTVNKVATSGMLIGNAYAGKGLGKAAWTLVVNQISRLLDLRKIKAGVADGNIAMRSIIENSGMKLEAILKDDLEFDGFTEDLLIYSKFFK